MSKRVPRSLRIGPFRYKVVRKRPATADFQVGEMNPKTQTISLDPALTPTGAAETLLHEILHAVWAQTGLGMSDDDEERVISALAPLLLDTLMRNGWNLFTFLLDPEF